ncbi:MAG: DinB family protein, partial [Terriglobales bacterium]
MATVAMPAGLPLTATAAAEMLQDARHRTLALAADLSEEQLRVPLSPSLNPPVWEMGHVGWFQEHWLLRHLAGAAPL